MIQTDRYVNLQYTQRSGNTDKQADEWKDRWNGRQTDKWVDGQTDAKTDRHTKNINSLMDLINWSGCPCLAFPTQHMFVGKAKSLTYGQIV